jgi:small subunit ribosomal protein S4
MARYTGPKWRISRRENASVFGDEKWRKRPTLPGQHPVSRKRPTNYAIQFREKQKVKRMYGMLEKQMRRFYETATKSKGNTATRLLQLLELRLDNVVYRLGFAMTRDQARQIVNHGHVKVNGKKVDIPSYIASVGDSIEIKDKITDAEWMKVVEAEITDRKTPQWLNKLKKGGEVQSEPTRKMMDPSIKESLIVEFYSR